MTLVCFGITGLSCKKKRILTFLSYKPFWVALSSSQLNNSIARPELLFSPKSTVARLRWNKWLHFSLGPTREKEKILNSCSLSNCIYSSVKFYQIKLSEIKFSSHLCTLCLCWNCLSWDTIGCHTCPLNFQSIKSLLYCLTSISMVSIPH